MESKIALHQKQIEPYLNDIERKARRMAELKTLTERRKMAQEIDDCVVKIHRSVNELLEHSKQL